MDESRLNEARDALEALLPEMKLDGLSITKVSFDFYTESVDVVFAWSGKEISVRLTTERLTELEAGRTFAAKHLRDQLYKTFDVQDD